MDEKKLKRLAVFLGVIGGLTILIFAFIAPFNDWSGNADATLLALYGDFIGGFVGSLFVLASIILLYLTLMAQKEALDAQKNSLDTQQTAINRERFETTFFNLLETQQKITDNILARIHYVRGIEKPTFEDVAGRKFFDKASRELREIYKAVSHRNYLGCHFYHFEEAFHEKNEDTFQCLDQDEQDILTHKFKEDRRIVYTNYVYEISLKDWEYLNSNDDKMREYTYYRFFMNYHSIIGHYFRHLYNILKFIEEYQKRRIENKKEDEQDINNDCLQYARFIQAQMSSQELVLLHYNSSLFPNMKDLVKKYEILDNLYEEDLFDNQTCIDNINLKKRSTLFKFD